MLSVGSSNVSRELNSIVSSLAKFLTSVIWPLRSPLEKLSTVDPLILELPPCCAATTKPPSIELIAVDSMDPYQPIMNQEEAPGSLKWKYRTCSWLEIRDTVRGGWNAHVGQRRAMDGARPFKLVFNLFLRNHFIVVYQLRGGKVCHRNNANRRRLRLHLLRIPEFLKLTQ